MNLTPIFNPLDYGIIFSAPRRLTDVDCWHMHIPFAFAVMAMVRPGKFVELGTHKGDSYCAFCQAVDELILDTACYAVDTWQGDDQTGFYGVDVLESLRAHHDPLYGGFSTLLKCLFDEALNYFSEGSVDLLHIDGHHTYESVRHDFESWLPKMSRRGAVLFHDTNVRERNFGVWRLWQEISGRYPSFEFPFGNGLGVLAVGDQVSEPMTAFLAYAKDHGPAVTRFFQDIAKKNILDAQQARLPSQLIQFEKDLLDRDQRLKQADAWLKQMQGALSDRDQRLQQADEWLRHNQAVIQEKDRRLLDIKALYEEQTRRLDEIYSSKGWKWLTRYRRMKALLGAASPRKATPHTRTVKADPGTYHAQVLHPIHAQRPKIVHAIANMWVGGSSRLIVDLIEHLGHKYDQEVVTFSIPDPPAYDGFPCHDFSQLSAPGDMADFLRERNAKILHVHYWGEDNKPWYETVFGAADLYACPVIENINTPVETYRHDKIRHYVYVSDYARNLFGPAPANSCVIYPGSNLDLFQRGERPVPDDVIGMVYRLERDKLNEESIDVFIDVVKKRPSTQAYIIGDGIFSHLYREKAEAAGILDRFVFTGYVPYESLPAYYRKFSLFVAPVWKESFGQVSTFAMSMGIPVVGYNVGGLPEMIGIEECFAGDRAQLVNLIVGLLDDREKRIAIGKANLDRARQMFSVETMAAQYDRLYEKLGSDSHF